MADPLDLQDSQIREGDAVVDYIHGPLISSSDLDAHARLFGAFGMREAGRRVHDAATVRTMWGVDAAAEEVLLETSGTRFGARLIRFDVDDAPVIRVPENGHDPDALKVIDFYAPDLEAARSHIESKGFFFKPEVADYEIPEGRFREAHVWGPDGVVCALISGDPAFFTAFATVRDRLVSEPQSISGPVQDPDFTLGFLADVFGLRAAHTYGVEDESFDALVGTKERMRLRAWNVGPDTTEPYFGIIDYGLPAGMQASLLELSRPPARGLIGASLFVTDVARVSTAAGPDRVLGPVETDLAGIGPAHIVTVRAPNGAWYQAIQTLT